MTKLRKEKQASEEESVKTHSSVSKLQREKEVGETELATLKTQLGLKEEECGRLKKELRYIFC